MRYLLTVFIFLSLQASAATGGKVYYVSNSGDDNNNGITSTSAWRTISKVNASWSTFSSGDQVLFEGGQTFTGTLTPTKAGASIAYINVGSWGTGKAILTTLVTVGSWPTFTGPGIYTSSQVISHGTTVPKIIVIDGVLKEIGRWPNIDDAGTDGGYLKHTSVSGSSWTDANYNTFANTSINPVTGNHTFNWVGATSVHRATHFNMDIGAVTSQSGSTFNYTSAGFNPKVGFGYYFTNSMQTLDRDGEWYFDPNTNKLSIYATSSLSNRTIKVATGNNNVDNKYNYITFENIIFEGANNSNLTMGSTVTTIQNSTIRFGGDNIRYSGANGPKILNNNISDALNFGILVKAGSNSLIEGNTVTNSGQWSSMGGNGTKENVGISINGGSTTVQYNSVFNSGYANMVVNNADNQIEQYNYCSNGLMVMDDGGAIYTIEDNGQLSAPRTNKKIRFNIVDRPSLNGFHGTTAKSPSGNVMGIYLDNYSSGVVVEGNTIIGSTVAMYGIRAANSKFLNNNVFDCHEKQILLTDRSPSNVRNMVYTGNNCLMTGTGGTPVTFFNNPSDVPVKSLASFDNNKYFRPAAPGIKFHIDKPDNGITDATFAQWNSSYSFDLNSSTASPVTTAVNTGNLYKIVFNASRTTQSFALDNKTWIDVNGVPYKSNTVSLAPYTSVMLMNTPNVAVTGGNQSPTVTVTSPANNSVYTQPANIIINANATDDGSITKVDFYNGSTLLGTDNSAPYTYSLNNAAAGSYSITAKATDNTGLTGVSPAVAFTVNQQSIPPTVNITSPAANATFTSPAKITVSANATDDGAVTKVDFYNGSTLIGTSTTAPYSISWPNVAAGSYSLTAKATDNSGLVTTSSAVNISVSGLVAPKVTITSPTNNSAYIAPASITINATATDPDGTVTKVEFYQNGTLVSTNNTSPYSYTLTNLSAGTYNLTAKAYDNDNQSTISAVVTVNVSKVKTAPSVSLTSPANGATATDPAKFDLSATASDADGSIAYVAFYSNNNLIGIDNAAPYSLSYTSVMAGTYDITAKAVDNDSLSKISGKSTITVTHINIPPSINWVSPGAGDSVLSNSTIDLSAVATDADGSISKVDFYNGSTALGTITAAPYSLDVVLAPGTYTLTATATDNSGATASKTLTFTVIAPQPTDPIRVKGHKAVIK